MDENGIILMMGSWAFEYENENGILMRQYHVDCHPAFSSKYDASEVNKKLGGSLSMHKPVDCCQSSLLNKTNASLKRICFLQSNGMVQKVKM